MQPATVLQVSHARRDALTAAALAALTFALYTPALNCRFVNLDDPSYVTENPHVRDGLSRDRVAWTLTTDHAGYWTPLTWLSFQLDATLWWPDPRGFHLTNVLLHAANAALVFLALRSLTGCFWRSAAVALLFAVHPLRVESVAWVAERKDVLSACFGLLALWAYGAYVRRPAVWRYLVLATAFVLSLMAKPMLVTLPCLLLVLDWWPLGRARTLGDWGRLVAGKLPLFALVAVSSAVAFRAQASAGAMGGAELFPLGVRVGNAFVSYVTYLAQTVWPVGLAVYHPHPSRDLEAWRVAGSVLVLAAVTAAALALARRAPYVLAGWLWYAGTLVPVIGFVQVGGVAYADHFTYVPQIGLLVAVCWGAADLARDVPRVALAAGAAAALVAAVLTLSQLQVWRDSVALWTHNLAVTGPNLASRMFLGAALQEQGRDEEAAEQFARACEEVPDSPEGFLNLGKLRLRQSRVPEAERLFTQATRLQPPKSDAFGNLGLIALNRGDAARAAECFREAVGLAPNSAEARDFFGRALAARGDLDAAAEQFTRAVRINPRAASCWSGLGHVRLRQRRYGEAVQCFLRALDLEPTSAAHRAALGAALEAARRARPGGTLLSGDAPAASRP